MRDRDLGLTFTVTEQVARTRARPNGCDLCGHCQLMRQLSIAHLAPESTPLGCESGPKPSAAATTIEGTHESAHSTTG